MDRADIESGSPEVHVQGFPEAPGACRVDQWGTQVRWPGDGREIFYIAPDGRMMAVAFTGRWRDGWFLLDPAVEPPGAPIVVSTNRTCAVQR